MGEVYPELTGAHSFMHQIVTNEEERFADTLDHGLKLLHEELAALKTASGQVLSGEVAFKLYDTYGFPLDLVQDALREEGLNLDYAGYEEHMRRQREASRAAWKGAGEEVPQVYVELSGWPPTHFLGYESISGDSTVLALIHHEAPGDQAEAGEEVEVVTTATPFYGEAGGQVGDTGRITGPGWKIEVTNTQRLPNDLIVHQGKVTEGVVRVNDAAHLEVDAARRARIARHHTATHLLQAALQKHLGSHIKQSGSLVTPERLRFDFTHFAAIDRETLEQVELDMNAAVAQNLPVEVVHLTMREALASGAMAIFEEKYGDEVRMVAIPGVSKELCGGTHVHRTGDIGLIKIASEASIAAGIRRLEGICGPEAVRLTQEEEDELAQAAGLLKAGRGELVGRLEKLIRRNKDLEKQVEALKSQIASVQAGDLLEQVRRVDGIQVLALEVAATDPKGLREFAVKLHNRLKSGIVVLGSRADDKALLIAMVSKDLTKRFNAGEIIRELAPLVGGSGGGRADMAQAGGPDKEKLSEALKQALEIVAQRAKG
jgi:alanyl-tRNA synthetase